MILRKLPIDLFLHRRKQYSFENMFILDDVNLEMRLLMLIRCNLLARRNFILFH